MLRYCLKCRKKKQESINPIVAKANKEKLIILSKCLLCDDKKSKIKNQEANELLSNLGLNTALSNIPILGNILC